jgi:hypothetical protein
VRHLQQGLAEHLPVLEGLQALQQPQVHHQKQPHVQQPSVEVGSGACSLDALRPFEGIGLSLGGKPEQLTVEFNYETSDRILPPLEAGFDLIQLFGHIFR